MATRTFRLATELKCFSDPPGSHVNLAIITSGFEFNRARMLSLSRSISLDPNLRLLLPGGVPSGEAHPIIQRIFPSCAYHSTDSGHYSRSQDLIHFLATYLPTSLSGWISVDSLRLQYSAATLVFYELLQSGCTAECRQT
ncbi:hypothetical protein RSOLAG1IB_08764 [Rhizoctonia solani AG-1 IB]|uniref:Uncharacterized protein n=1 Tax=Thanatephorus cucumeris (strain AG1-IB / isolate 7/3/14) TaxID=1108050 RepID=A0A0B7FP64_THACB|nr:hypothetical protein RSOLAG1IB_08764 [Rhizoctonia solani AG-1 IB]